MPIAKSSIADSVQAAVTKDAVGAESTGLGGFYTMTCFDKDGNLKWEEKFHNLVVDAGTTNLVNVYFKSGGATASWYLGLVSGASAPTYDHTDTMPSHAGWTELNAGTTYSGSVRPTCSFNASPTITGPSTSPVAGLYSATLSNSSSPAVFSIIATAVVAGAFLNSQPTGTSGTLFSAGSFTGGNKNVAAGDTVNVTYTFNAQGA
jgi:hypothetical protein